jgi:hypothetical protein
MKDVICHGALLKCQWGLIPTPLKCMPFTLTTAAKKKIATIMDFAPNMNIGSFGLCRSPITTIYTPAGPIYPPCMPAVVAPWQGGNPKVKVNGRQILTPSSKCMCIKGMGKIQIMLSTFPNVKQ